MGPCGTDAYTYPEAQARHYDGDYEAIGRTQDIPFYVQLAEAADGPVMEMACGTGRVLLPMARAGATVTGVEPTPAMRAKLLAKLQHEPEEVRGRVTLLDGRFDRVPAPGPFALICSPFRAFQHLCTRDDQVAGLRAMAAVLAPDGVLAFDVFDYNPALGAKHGKNHVDCTYEDAHGRTVQRTSSTERYEDGHMLDVTMRWSVDGEDTGEACTCTMRVVFRDEIDELLAEAGLRAEAVFGDFDMSPRQADNPRELVILAKHAR
ncbi:MAG: class I SAM-dependent methyltransferase [Planctomycetota bacterium]|jgi:SAM-dependent methyltransferase